MLFFPDVLAGQLPATYAQVQSLARKALLANRAAGKGFAVVELRLDGYSDWSLRQDSAFADGLFRAVLEKALHGEERAVCGSRLHGAARVYLQALDAAQARLIATHFCEVARNTNLAQSGGPRSLSLSIGLAHLTGFRGHPNDCEIADLEHSASRGARLATRTGGDRLAAIEKFGVAQPSRQEVDAQSAGAGEFSQSTAHESNPAPRPPEPSTSANDRKFNLVSQDDAPLESELKERYGAEFAEWLASRDKTWERRVEMLERRLEKIGQWMDSCAVDCENSPAPALWASTSWRLG